MQHPPADLPDATVAGLVVAAWGLDVADVVPTLLAAHVETPDTAWQVEALLDTLDEL